MIMKLNLPWAWEDLSFAWQYSRAAKNLGSYETRHRMLLGSGLHLYSWTHADWVLCTHNQKLPKFQCSGLQLAAALRPTNLSSSLDISVVYSLSSTILFFIIFPTSICFHFIFLFYLFLSHFNFPRVLLSFLFFFIFFNVNKINK